MGKSIRISLLLCSLLITAQVYSQQNSTPSTGTSGTDTGYNGGVSRYINKATSDLFYGIEHYGYPAAIEGLAYYNTAEWQKGSVVYNDVLYTDVLLKYDLVADELIVLHPNNYFGVTLRSEKISTFTIGDNAFVYLQPNNRYAVKPGFYEQAVSGKLSMLVKRTKKIEEKIVYGEIKKKFIEDYSFYALLDHKIYPVTNLNSILDVLGDKGRKIRTYLKEKEISFRDSKEMALQAIAIYYNQLPE